MKSPYTRTIRTIYGSTRGRTPFFLERPGRGRRAWWLALFLFLLAAAAGVSFYFFGQTGPAFTGDRFTMALYGNANPQPGRAEDYTFRAANNEEVAVDGAEFFIDFTRPAAGRFANQAAGSVSAALISSEPPPLASGGATWKMGEIKSGETVEIKLKLSFWGKTGEEITLPFVATFRPKGFGSDFSAVGSQKFVLGEPALGLAVSGPDKAASGAEAAFTVTIANAAGEASFKPEEWSLELPWPSGFEVISFDPPSPFGLRGASPSLGEAATTTPPGASASASWPLSALPLAAGRYTLSWRGRVQTEAGGEAVFSVHLKNTLRGLQINAEKKVIVKNSDVSLSLRAAPEEGKKLQWGEKVTWRLEVKNQGRENLRSGIVSVALSGDEFWQSDSLAAGAGRFEGGSVFWDKTSAKELEKIAPGQAVSLFFSFTALSAPPPNAAAAVILADGRFRGQSDAGEVEARSGEVEIKVLANIDLSASAASVGSSGMHPPLPGQETIYPVQWNVGPSTNELADLRVFTTLPKDVIWKNAGPVASGELTYEATSRTVVWKLAKSEKITAPLSIVFFVGITPRQEATNSLVIIESSTLTATDPLAQDNFELYTPAVLLGDVK